MTIKEWLDNNVGGRVSVGTGGEVGIGVIGVLEVYSLDSSMYSVRDNTGQVVATFREGDVFEVDDLDVSEPGIIISIPPQQPSPLHPAYRRENHNED